MQRRNRQNSGNYGDGRKIRVFRCPKEGTFSEDQLSFNCSRGIYVLCDGASEGFNGRGWAREVSLQSLRGRSIQWILHKARFRFSQNWNQRSMTDWSALLARRKGSYTTLLRVQVFPHCIEVFCIGDTAFFFLEGFHLVAGIPSLDSEYYSQSPSLLSDHPPKDSPLVIHTRIPWRAYWNPSFLLATDALASHLCSLSLPEQKEFLQFLYRSKRKVSERYLREAKAVGLLRQDDLTYMWVRLRS
ncbi:MAG: hypothetical protein SNJ78_08170 [Spirochaetales bacterium]